MLWEPPHIRLAPPLSLSLGVSFPSVLLQLLDPLAHVSLGVAHLCTIMALLSKLGHIYLKPFSAAAPSPQSVAFSVWLWPLMRRHRRLRSSFVLLLGDPATTSSLLTWPIAIRLSVLASLFPWRPFVIVRRFTFQHGKKRCNYCRIL